MFELRNWCSDFEIDFLFWRSFWENPFDISKENPCFISDGTSFNWTSNFIFQRYNISINFYSQQQELIFSNRVKYTVFHLSLRQNFRHHLKRS